MPSARHHFTGPNYNDPRREIIAIQTIVDEMGIELPVACLEDCPWLKEFMGSVTVVGARDIFEGELRRIAQCPGQKHKAFGRVACGSGL